MFTGIIETLGVVDEVAEDRSNRSFTIRSAISDQLKVDQSVSHNGVCLTVTALGSGTHQVTAVGETLMRSTLGSWKKGTVVNLERCMLNNGRFDGHIVQGHVDQKGRVVSVKDQQGSWLVTIGYDRAAGNVTVEKGSIALDGISLTCFNSEIDQFSVAIIPYTWDHTNVHTLREGQEVNLEFDIIGKYVRRLTQASR